MADDGDSRPVGKCHELLRTKSVVRRSRWWLRRVRPTRAKLGGPDAPMSGDPGVTSVSVKMVGKDTLQETDKRNGKVIGVFTMTVAENGKTAKGTFDDKLQNRSSASRC